MTGLDDFEDLEKRITITNTCHSCDRYLQSNWNYCPRCGAPISSYRFDI